MGFPPGFHGNCVPPSVPRNRGGTHMLGTTWLAYFEGNAREDRAPAASLLAEVPVRLRAPLVRSIGRFQLGESAGGKIHDEIATHPDRALDRATRRSVQLYVEEEWRHSRELAMIIRAL